MQLRSTNLVHAFESYGRLKLKKRFIFQNYWDKCFCLAWITKTFIFRSFMFFLLHEWGFPESGRLCPCDALFGPKSLSKFGNSNELPCPVPIVSRDCPARVKLQIFKQFFWINKKKQKNHISVVLY